MVFYLLKRNDLESPLIFVLFLKGKQNKKENLSMNSYLEKVVCEKPNQVQGSVYLSERYGNDCSTL